MFTIFICLRFRDSFTIQTTVIYLNSQIIPDISALTFDRHPLCLDPRPCRSVQRFPDSNQNDRYLQFLNQNGRWFMKSIKKVIMRLF